jgi:hypothetical protein
MHKFARLLLITLAVVVSCVSIAMAAPSAPSAAPAAGTSIQLALDPFMASAEASSSSPMRIRCPCSIFTGCGGLPIGYDCAEPAGCCHCDGTNPNTRICVYNAH